MQYTPPNSAVPPREEYQGQPVQSTYPPQPQHTGTQPTQPQGYAQPAQQAQPAPTTPAANPNSATFIADDKVLELISKVHPQLASAMINIAIKKFVEDPDFMNYFIRDEHKIEITNEINSRQESTVQEQIPEVSAAPSPSINFGDGW